MQKLEAKVVCGPGNCDMHDADLGQWSLTTVDVLLHAHLLQDVLRHDRMTQTAFLNDKRTALGPSAIGSCPGSGEGEGVGGLAKMQI